MDKKNFLPIFYKVILSLFGSIILISPLFERIGNYKTIFFCYILTVAWGMSLLFSFSNRMVNRKVFHIAILMSFIFPFLASTLIGAVFLDSLISAGIIFTFCAVGLFYEKYRVSR